MIKTANYCQEFTFVHTHSEVTDRFGTTLRRLRLINGLKLAMDQLQAAGCQFIYINGSFVTEKPNPGDFDTRTNTPKGIIAIDLSEVE